MSKVIEALIKVYEEAGEEEADFRVPMRSAIWKIAEELNLERELGSWADDRYYRGAMD